MGEVDLGGKGKASESRVVCLGKGGSRLSVGYRVQVHVCTALRAWRIFTVLP